MASHMNAHNMPGPKVADRSSKPWHKRLLWVIVGILIFIVLDRASMLLIPVQYHGLPDMEQYHTLYYSSKMQRFKQVKDHLDTVILGDSRSRHGVDPALFSDQSRNTNVTAFNFAPASSGIDFTDLIIREYFLGMPNLKTVVWGVSPRIFNRYWNDPVYNLFLNSQGYQTDKLEKNKGFSRAGVRAAVQLSTARATIKFSKAFAHRSKFKAIMLDHLPGKGKTSHFYEEQVIDISDCGFMEIPQSQTIDLADDNVVDNILKSLDSGRFEIAADRLLKFQDIIHYLKQRQIRLVCFVPPMHHSLNQSPAADADGTPDKDYEDLVSVLKSYEQRYGNYLFVDLHKAGNNDFTDSEFGDFDHLNRKGSTKLSLMIAQVLENCDTQFASDTQTLNGNKDVQVTPYTPKTDISKSINDPKPAVSSGADQTPPTIVSHLGDLDYMVGAFPPDNRPLIWAEYSDDSSGIDIGSIKMFIDQQEITSLCDITPEKISFKPEKTLDAPQLYKFTVIVSDKAGNKAKLVWEILLKRC